MFPCALFQNKGNVQINNEWLRDIEISKAVTNSLIEDVVTWKPYVVRKFKTFKFYPNSTSSWQNNFCKLV